MPAPPRGKPGVSDVAHRLYRGVHPAKEESMEERDLEARRAEERRPLEEAGQGEAEGFEQSEQELIDAAEHGDGAGDPEVDAFTPEAESDRSDAAYGEADEIDPNDPPDS